MAFCPVVTNVVNPTAFSLKIVVFGRRLTTFVTGVLTRCSKLLWFDDVCNGYCPRAPRPGPVGQAARLCETVITFAGAGRVSTETGIAFACLCLCGVETDIAFAGAGRASTETGVAFAAEKWVFLVCFSAAVVLLVSMVAVQGRAVVMVVSCWPASVAAEVSLVAKSPRAGSCARKSSPCLV